MITKRDREIINFIEKYGFLTIEQAAKIFFNTKSGYDLSRRRLKKIEESADYIKAIKNTETNQLVYMNTESKIRRVSKHDLLVMDYIANLVEFGADFENIEVEKNFNNEVIADAFLKFKLGDYRYFQLLEIQLRHDYVDVNRYNSVMQEILKETNNIIPTLIIVQNTNHNYNKENETDMEIVQLDTELTDIAKTVI